LDDAELNGRALAEADQAARQGLFALYEAADAIENHLEQKLHRMKVAYILQRLISRESLGAIARRLQVNASHLRRGARTGQISRELYEAVLEAIGVSPAEAQRAFVQSLAVDESLEMCLDLVLDFKWQDGCERERGRIGNFEAIRTPKPEISKESIAAVCTLVENAGNLRYTLIDQLHWSRMDFTNVLGTKEFQEFLERTTRWAAKLCAEDAAARARLQSLVEGDVWDHAKWLVDAWNSIQFPVYMATDVMGDVSPLQVYLRSNPGPGNGDV
jgi:hypothetical protein